MPPGQRAAAINCMPWDPSVKAVDEFPTALDIYGTQSRLDSALWQRLLQSAWRCDERCSGHALSGARRRQPAQHLVRKSFINGPEILIAPVNPELVYVPWYNPWGVYGAPVPAWGGFYVLPTPRGVSGALACIGFAAAISIGLYAHYGWGWHAWSPNWHSGRVYYNHATWYSRSNSVYNHGHFGGYNRGAYEHGGRGVPGDYHPIAHETHGAYTHGGPEGVHHASSAGAYHAGTAGGYHSGAAGAYHSGSTGAYHGSSAGAYHGSSTPAHNAYHASPVTPHGGSHSGVPGGGMGHSSPATEHAGGGSIHNMVSHAPSGGGGGGHPSPPHAPEAAHGHH